jgi:hypothetical protein
MLAKYDREKQPVILRLLSPFMYPFVRLCGMFYSAMTTVLALLLQPGEYFR